MRTHAALVKRDPAPSPRATESEGGPNLRPGTHSLARVPVRADASGGPIQRKITIGRGHDAREHRALPQYTHERLIRGKDKGELPQELVAQLEADVASGKDLGAYPSWDAAMAALVPKTKSSYHVGSGDFGKQLDYARKHPYRRVTATSLDSREEVLRKYGPAAQQHIDALRETGATVQHEVDATRLEHTGPEQHDQLVWDFPHTGVYGGGHERDRDAFISNAELMLGFMHSAHSKVKPGGQMQIKVGGWPYIPNAEKAVFRGGIPFQGLAHDTKWQGPEEKAYPNGVRVGRTVGDDFKTTKAKRLRFTKPPEGGGPMFAPPPFVGGSTSHAHQGGMGSPGSMPNMAPAPMPQFGSDSVADEDFPPEAFEWFDQAESEHKRRESEPKHSGGGMPSMAPAVTSPYFGGGGKPSMAPVVTSPYFGAGGMPSVTPVVTSPYFGTGHGAQPPTGFHPPTIPPTSKFLNRSFGVPSATSVPPKQSVAPVVTSPYFGGGGGMPPTSYGSHGVLGEGRESAADQSESEDESDMHIEDFTQADYDEHRKAMLLSDSTSRDEKARMTYGNQGLMAWLQAAAPHIHRQMQEMHDLIQRGII